MGRQDCPTFKLLTVSSKLGQTVLLKINKNLLLVINNIEMTQFIILGYKKVSRVSTEMHSHWQPFIVINCLLTFCVWVGINVHACEGQRTASGTIP